MNPVIPTKEKKIMGIKRKVLNIDNQNKINIHFTYKTNASGNFITFDNDVRSTNDI